MEVPESGNKINKGIQARKFRAYLKNKYLQANGDKKW